MAARIQENELLLPALYVIYLNGKANTSQIKMALIEVFNPQGEDAEILAGRKDTKFTQIVRNLMGSHYESNGMSGYTSKDSNKYFSLTDNGKKVVENNISYLEYLFANSFEYGKAISLSATVYKVRNQRKKLYVYAEDDKVMEGKAEVKVTVVKERSQKLRAAAISHYTVDGTIACSVCGFDFKKVYGELGDGYIQMHHENPIFQYSDDGFEAYISEAVKNMKPLCANCHCMVHRNKNKLISISELKDVLDSNK